MSLLRSLLALTLFNSPPSAVPDARGEVVIWCMPTCDDAQVAALEAKLAEHFTLRRWLPLRDATGVRAMVKRMPAAAYTYGLPAGEGRDTSRLSDVDYARLEESQEVLVVAHAAPLSDSVLKHSRRVARAAHTFANESGALVEDADTAQVFDPAGWWRARVVSLDPDALRMWELFSLEWSAEGDRVVTRGLRELGLHDYVIEGVDERVADDVAVTLVLMAQHELERGALTTWTALDVEALSSQSAKDWLRGWRVYGDDPGAVAEGSGALTLELRNTLPMSPVDPEGPLLKIGPSGALEDADAWAKLMDEAWGWADAAPADLAVPAQGWSVGG